MDFKNFLAELNIFAQCKKYGVSLWQCPQFLFLVMGIFIIVTTLATYALGARYVAEPQIVVLIVLLITAVLLSISFIITQSFERLAEANRMKSEFINIVSHQLRTPLTNLKWTVEFLVSKRADGITEKQTEYFRNLTENINRMGELINNLLIISKIETTGLALKKKEFSLVTLIQELIPEFEPFAQATNIKLEFKPGGELPKISADPEQLRLVVENFLDNAIRYIKSQGKVEIKLEKKGPTLYFEIKDNGIGIPRDEQKYIFQKFFRAENVLKYQTQGSGLGLYISKTIVERSGGKIGFKSEEGKGSTFWFTLPIK